MMGKGVRKKSILIYAHVFTYLYVYIVIYAFIYVFICAQGFSWSVAMCDLSFLTRNLTYVPWTAM